MVYNFHMRYETKEISSMDEVEIQAQALIELAKDIAEQFVPIARDNTNDGMVRAQRIVATQKQFQSTLEDKRYNDIGYATGLVIHELSKFYDANYAKFPGTANISYTESELTEIEGNSLIFIAKAKILYAAAFAAENPDLHYHKETKGFNLEEETLGVAHLEKLEDKYNSGDHEIPQDARYNMPYLRDIVEVELKHEMPFIPGSEGNMEFDDILILLIRNAGAFDGFCKRKRYEAESEE